MRRLYSALFTLAMPLVFGRLLWKSRKVRGYRERWAERLAMIQCPEKFKKGIWIHAASVGESVAAVPLAKELQKRYPQLPIAITTITPTGSAQVKTSLKDSVFHVYVPYDVPCAVNRFLDQVQPKFLIVMETELWPNILHYTHERKIPIVLANARLSEKSTRKYGAHWLKTAMKEMMNNIAFLAAQSEIDATRYESIGMAPDKIQVVGNIKFDCALPEKAKELGLQLRNQLGAQRPVWIAASTHEGEEEIVLQAHQKIKEAIPSCLLILAPRHPDRRTTILPLCETYSMKTAIRSKQETTSIETNVYLADTLGELFTCYAASDVAFVGGSLVPIGGHNLLEPAMLGLPVLTGPQLFGQPGIWPAFEARKAYLKIKNVDELANAVIRLLQSETERHEFGQRALAIVESNRGALTRHMSIIEKYLQ